MEQGTSLPVDSIDYTQQKHSDNQNLNMDTPRPELCGFTDRQLRKAGIITIDRARRPDLDKTGQLHPFFYRQCFEGFTNEEYTDLLPTLHLASRLLTLPYALTFWDGLFGEALAGQDLTFSGCSTRFVERGHIKLRELTGEQKNDTLSWLSELAQKNNTALASDNPTKETIQYQWGSKLKDSRADGYTFSHINAGGRKRRPFVNCIIQLRRKYRTHLRFGHLDPQDEPRKYCCYLRSSFLIATTLVHELAHAIYAILSSLAGDLSIARAGSEEPCVDACGDRELGWSWSRKVFQGDLLPLHKEETYVNTLHGIKYIPSKAYEGEPRYTCPVSMEYFSNMHRYRYWDEVIRIHGKRALIPPRVLCISGPLSGASSQSSQIVAQDGRVTDGTDRVTMTGEQTQEEIEGAIKEAKEYKMQ